MTKRPYLLPFVRVTIEVQSSLDYPDSSGLNKNIRTIKSPANRDMNINESVKNTYESKIQFKKYFQVRNP